MEHRLGGSSFFAGIAGSYETVRTRMNGSIGDGERYQVGMTLGYRDAGFEARAYGTFGLADVDTARPVLAPGQVSLALGRQEFNFGELGGRISYDLPVADIVVRPALDAGYIYYEQQGAVETGADPVSLMLDHHSGGHGFVRPSLRLMSSLGLDGVTLKPAIAVGFMHRFDSEVGVVTRFTGAPPEVVAFPSVAPLDRNAATLDAGITADFGNVRVRAGVVGEYGKHTTASTFQAKLTIDF